MANVVQGRAAGARQTRRNIVEAARIAFVERGLVPVSLRDVAAGAGVSHPGLLRHFSSKASLIDAVFEGLDDELGRVLDGMAAGEMSLGAVARATAAVPSFDTLASMLETADGAVEARARLGKRWADISRRLDGSPSVAALGLEQSLVLWTGLRLLAQYLPGDIQPAGFLDAEAGLGVRLESVGVPEVVVTLADMAERSGIGYAPGEKRREEILSDATSRFARHGYHGTSVRDVADGVNVSPSTLLYHFGSKEQLLTAVLRRRDEMLASRAQEDVEPAEELAAIGADARLDARDEPGLIELHTRVASEAVAVGHPAHGYLAERYRRAIAYFTRLIGDARGEGGRDGFMPPAVAAVQLVGLWEGLQIQALGDGDFRGIGDQLDAYVDSILPQEGRGPD